MAKYKQNAAKSSELLEQCFPDHAQSIKKLRLENADFDAICGDFEILSRELARLHQNKQNNNQILEEQILESQKGLQEEIAAYLKLPRKKKRRHLTRAITAPFEAPNNEEK